MRRLALGLALASTALATPALARDKSWYVEGDLGATIVESNRVVNIGANQPAGGSTVGYFNTKTGYDFGGIIGYDFGPFRLETEASYRRAQAKKFTTAAGTVYDSSNSRVAGGTGVLSFMVNGLLDFGPDDGLQGFVGGGVGVARVKNAIYTSAPNNAGGVDDSASGFAYQALAGIRAPISKNVDLGLKYRYFAASGANRFVSLQGNAFVERFHSHSLLATLTYNFGSPTPPPPPPPPAPVCNKGPYIVFFDWDKSDITPQAATILDSAIQAYGNCGTTPIVLAGYADRSGTPKYNLGLSARRNTSVRAYLTTHGVADGAISGTAYGEANPRVPTADGVRELQNRRVEITYGPGSGN